MLREPSKSVVFLGVHVLHESVPEFHEVDRKIESFSLDSSERRRYGDLDVDSHLLSKLTHKCSFLGLGTLDVSPRQVPCIGIPNSTGAAVAQEHPSISQKRSSNNVVNPHDGEPSSVV